LLNESADAPANCSRIASEIRAAEPKAISFREPDMGSRSIRCANPVHYEERGNQERVEVTCALGKTASHFIGVFQEIKDLEATLKSDSIARL